MVGNFREEMDLESARNRTVNTGDIASPSLAIGIEDSMAEADGTYHEISAKKQRLDSMLVKVDRGENTNPALRGSEKTVHSDPRGTRTVHRKREKTRKRSSKKADKRLREEENAEMLRKIARELDRENSQLTDTLRLLSEQCQDINDENNLLEDEMEKMYGEDAIADLRAKNPANAKPENNPNSDGDGSNECNSDSDDDTNKTLQYRKII